MRKIIRKLDKKEVLTTDEYELLQSYLDNLSQVSFDSYEIFYSRYASLLWSEYNLYISRFKYDIDDFLNYLIYHPELISQAKRSVNIENLFPPQFQPYLEYLHANGNLSELLGLIGNNLNRGTAHQEILPQARVNNVVLKYENDNPYKEIGLKAHFGRLCKYQFITRLQSYRYLTRNKAKEDGINALAGDKLSGIFTNKYKSIYYYIFLTENDDFKAQAAAAILNLALYGRP